MCRVNEHNNARHPGSSVYLVHGPAERTLQSNLVCDSTQSVGDSFARFDCDRFRLAVEEVNPVNNWLQVGQGLRPSTTTSATTTWLLFIECSTLNGFLNVCVFLPLQFSLPFLFQVISGLKQHFCCFAPIAPKFLTHTSVLFRNSNSRNISGKPAPSPAKCCWDWTKHVS